MFRPMTVVDDVITDLFLWLNLTLSHAYWLINPIKGVGISVEIISGHYGNMKDSETTSSSYDIVAHCIPARNKTDCDGLSDLPPSPHSSKQCHVISIKSYMHPSKFCYQF